MLKKIFLIIVSVLIIFGFVACQKEKRDSSINAVNSSAEVSDTKVVENITNKNGTAVFIQPGDHILIDLEGEKKSQYQWSYKEPVSGGFLALKDHPVMEKTDSNNKKIYVSQWRLKVLKEGIFTFRMNYEDSLKPEKPLKTFIVKVISGKKIDDIPGIILDTPSSGEGIEKEFLISGYHKAGSYPLVYILQDNSGTSVQKETLFPASETKSDFLYFEKKIKAKLTRNASYSLIVFHEAAGTETRLDEIVFPIKTQ